MWLIHMRKFLLIVLLLLVDPATCISDVGIEVQYCGFEQTCVRNRTDADQTNDSCCQPCECAEVCKERDTCCTDKEQFGDITKVIKQECLPAVYMPEGHRSPTNIQSHYTRTRCPNDFQDLSIQGKCENTIFESLDDITFVTSEDGNIVYKNRYCGLCHGEKRTINWKLRVSFSCMKMPVMQNASLTTAIQALLEHCSIGFEASENLLAKNTICSERAISQCNQTGDWEVYDRRLEDLCRRPPEYVNYYKMNRIGHVTVYQSVYCYLCNSDAIAKPESCRLDDFRLPKQSFTGLINQNAWPDSDDQDGKSKTCMADQILDTFFNVCRYLYCPRFFVSNYGQCRPLFIQKLRYPLHVRLVPLAPVNKTESVKMELPSKYPKVLKDLGFSRCKLSGAFIYLKRDINETLLSDVFMQFTLMATERCKLEHMVSELNSIEMTPSTMNIMLSQKLVRFEAFWDNTTMFRNDQYELIFGTPTFLSYPRLQVARVSNCEKVKLTTEELQTVQKNHASANELLFAPVPGDTNGAVFVCCAKYIVKPRSVGVKKQFSVVKVLLTVMIASVLPAF